MLPVLAVIIWLVIQSGSPIVSVIAIASLILGVFAIWLATSLLIFRPLHEIESISSLFATGDLSARIRPMQNASSRISQLSDSFNSLADDISAREADMLESLAEKEVLLREIHHRVKNNLQIIISLLNMQERKQTDQETINVIRETRSRINAIALVHRGLYEGKDISVIKMDTFLGRLTSELMNGLNADERDLDIAKDFEALKFLPDTAIPVALFVVETLTNALQHGVPEGGKITLSLATEGNDIVMSVRDDGAGFHENAIRGTGSKLINGFARQLSGRIEEDHENGYGVSLIFNVDA